MLGHPQHGGRRHLTETPCRITAFNSSMLENASHRKQQKVSTLVTSDYCLMSQSEYLSSFGCSFATFAALPESRLLVLQQHRLTSTVGSGQGTAPCFELTHAASANVADASVCEKHCE